MGNDEKNREIAFEQFLTAAGRSFGDAQNALTEGLDLAANLVVSEAQLEVKAALNADVQGGLAVQTISAQAISQGGIDPGLVSTVKINFTATRGEPASDITQPKRTSTEVVEEVSKRQDVVAMEKILGNFKYDAAYVSGKERWLVTVRDPQDRLVREYILPD